MAEPRGVSAHLVLLGLPGAGKSTVGPLVAARLGRRFVDLDTAIEAQAGLTVREIFSAQGEAAFRAHERELSATLLAPESPPLVLAPGGGWVEDPRNRARLGPEVVAVYLRVSAEVAVARMGPAVSDRPLLAGADRLAKLRELQERREPMYLQAQHTVSVDSMTPGRVASYIVALARGELGD